MSLPEAKRLRQDIIEEEGQKGKYLRKSTEALKTFKECPKKCKTVNCWQFFRAAHFLCEANMKLGRHEKEVIANMIKDLISDLDFCIVHFSYVDYDRGVANLKVRSGWQYIVDQLKDFQTESNETMGDLFVLLQEGLEWWDSSLEFYKEGDYLNPDGYDPDPDDFLRPPNVPPTHTWWK